MNKHINKFVGLGLALSILPQIALASWWNPFSWFEKKPTTTDTKTEVLEKRIQELESKLNGTATSTATSSGSMKERKEVPVIKIVFFSVATTILYGRTQTIFFEKAVEISYIIKTRIITYLPNCIVGFEH